LLRILGGGVDSHKVAAPGRIMIIAIIIHHNTEQLMSPTRHKLASINYVINRVHTYPITKEAKHSEITTIKSILHNNEYDTNLMKRPTKKRNQETDTDTKNKTIRFLDIEIHRKNTELQFLIHRKTTQTDIIIPNTSCHPHEHKLTSINYLINRVHTYPMTK
jgi:hypothetical protein